MRLRNLLSTASLDPAALSAVLATARRTRSETEPGHRPLAGRTLCMAFLAESARTRACLEEAAAQLGVELRDMTAAALTLGRGPDAALEFSRAAAEADALAIRHSLVPGRAQALLAEIAAASGRPVLNLQSELDHPVQTLADLLTLQDAAPGGLPGVKVAVTWAWQRTPTRPPSVPQGLLTLLPRFGVELRLAHPPGFELAPEAFAQAESLAEAGGRVVRCATLDAALAGADFVYPQGWAPQAMLHRPDDAAALAAPFSDWIVDATRLGQSAPGARVLRSLPAAPGEEIGADLLESDRSLYFTQSANRLAMMRAILLESIPGGGVEA